eukprot:CAMPEP_0202883730 /NCGR_PEP_ID=MMETSP1391-20130828/39875_1 /ASSEMBLY_ACC=CAM_ASM_000867 /TAXON_ID=1034604 /ORGANISM="Chlamydomonas leiostraca, Strain SAG 11-49" /LENGTH=255 /DNA_ID=CAMNT_0049566799 /DNA_START=29 /DNA_END=793 /DNA_ORIENTATION=+
MELYNTVPEPVLVYDPSGTLVFHNHAAQRAETLAQTFGRQCLNQIPGTAACRLLSGLSETMEKHSGEAAIHRGLLSCQAAPGLQAWAWTATITRPLATGSDVLVVILHSPDQAVKDACHREETARAQAMALQSKTTAMVKENEQLRMCADKMQELVQEMRLELMRAHHKLSRDLEHCIREALQPLPVPYGSDAQDTADFQGLDGMDIMGDSSPPGDGSSDVAIMVTAEAASKPSTSAAPLVAPVVKRQQRRSSMV